MKSVKEEKSINWNRLQKSSYDKIDTQGQEIIHVKWEIYIIYSKK